MSGRDPDQLLQFYLEAGADEAIGEEPVDRYQAKPEPPAPVRVEAVSQPVRPTPPPLARPAAAPVDRALKSAEGAASTARDIAAACNTLDELRQRLSEFEGCAIKATATNLVFGDGNPNADLMVVGEAPGAEEDRQGLPFVGESGQLLDRILAAIGQDRSTAYITNMLPWRPPGNRKPTPQEVLILRPFIERHIALVGPRVLLFVGGTSANALLDRSEGITRLRGRWFDYHGCNPPIPAMATYHPAYLLRQPAHKREVWRDFLKVKIKLDA